MSERTEKIREMLAKDGDDVFLRYSLGMELARAGLFEDAVGEFQKCIGHDDAYLPAYVEAGKALRAAGLPDRARDVFTQALDLATNQAQHHVRDHIQQQLQSLPKPD